MMTRSDYQDHADSYGGLCLACGDLPPSGIEPDAEGYECEACGEPAVCGIEQALLLGRLGISDDKDES